MSVKRCITLAFSLVILLAFSPDAVIAQDTKDPPVKEIKDPPIKKFDPPCSVLASLPLPKGVFERVCGKSKDPGPPIKK